MTINTQTKISTILRKSPEALYAIVQLSPKFTKLRNPVLRKVMAPRVNIAQAAKIGGCTPQHFYDALRPLGFVTDNKNLVSLELDNTEEKPEWLLHAENNKIVMLDVRPILEAKQDPLNHITDALKMLGKEEILCVLNTFEPTPLINLLAKKNYIHHVENMAPDKVFTYFRKQVNEPFSIEKPVLNQQQDFDKLLQKFGNKLLKVDVREMEMPQPMFTILESAAKLPEANALFVDHKRVPVYLLPELDERGFQYCIKEVAAGDVKLLIYRK